eukprot:gene5445-9258_t
MRLEEINKFETETKISVYPTKYFKATTSIFDFRKKFEHLNKSERLKEITHVLVGRIELKRDSSKKLVFLTIKDSEENSVQILSSKQNFEEEKDFELLKLIKKGDIISIKGYPGSTNTGELSLISTKIQILTPCLHQLPLEYNEVELRFRNRHLDFLVNKDLKKTFLIRNAIIKFTRNYLENLNFIEVETPMLQSVSGGANAKPFETHLLAMNLDLKLRIAPEIFLKKLVVGGFDRVFEIGKVFRNEGTDSTHNPEFTSCEFYQAYSNYEELMSLTEEYLSSLIHHITGKYKIKVGDKDIDFTPPFRRLSFLGSIEEKLNTKLPNASDENCNEILLKICKENHIKIDEKRINYSYLIDKLSSHFIEPELIQPTFLIDHPMQLSPLAKNKQDNENICERFELFVNSTEICNAYSELNDPRVQKERFEMQAKQRNNGDDEAQEFDLDFCEALEYGLPPTGGWGCGIDRLVMLLTNNTQIRNVILFPLMKPK